jgi:competence ComEA-like helix-hairpin-helix protein
MFRIFLAAMLCACMGLPATAFAQGKAKAPPPVATQGAKINPNTATPAELTSIKGIGKKKADLIIAGRPYASLDDLLGVKGIGKKTLERLRLHMAIPTPPPAPKKKK